jgi:hypothetical protein
MELRHLRYFVTLAEELHFARAAEVLGIAPPTLTVQIQEIERTLSAKLFTRTKRSVALTSAGEVFLAEAKGVLAQFAKAESVGRRAGRGEIGRIEVGYMSARPPMRGSFSSKQACSGGPGRASISRHVNCPWRIFRASSMRDMSTSALSACP